MDPHGSRIALYIRIAAGSHNGKPRIENRNQFCIRHNLRWWGFAHLEGPMTNTTFNILASLGAVYLVYHISKRRKNLPLPPGPKGYPIIGNALDMPEKYPWVKYHHWCKEYGSDIIYLNVAGVDTVVLDTYEAVMELLEKRSAIYSSRTRLPMINELMGWEFDTAFAPYGDQWRAQRKLMHQVFNASAAKNFQPHSLKAAHGLLRRFLRKPEDILGNLSHMAGANIIAIAYGLEAQPDNDPIIRMAEAGNRSVTEAGVPGAFLVDSYPILKYIPEWVPGAGFQKKAREWRKLAEQVLEMPFKAAKSRIDSGNYVPSFVSYCYNNIDEKEDPAKQEYLFKGTAAALYTAGVDTTVSVVSSCMLAMIKHPEILKRAQAHIDSVIPFGELPTFAEEDRLPFITAICMETMRWRDSVPIAIPHMLTQDDVYKGYRLPKGSVVVPNAWAMLHNEEDYPDPFTFNPDRFLKDGKLDEAVRDPSFATFGFGRRICPGRFLAISGVWIAIASLIAAFDITKAVDENGNVIEADPEYISSLLYIAKPFTCSVKPRSKKHEQAIQATAHQDYEFRW